MTEVFVKPAVSAIIEKKEDDKRYILVQRRQKADGGKTNGLIEVVGGKVREYESIFDALRREVFEETGLRVTEILGEERCRSIHVDGTEVIAFSPFCTVQNLSGLYSLMIHTFICHVEGEPLRQTDEATDIHWESADMIEKILDQSPQSVFPTDIPPLRKYLGREK